MFFIETTRAVSPEADQMKNVKFIVATIASVMALGLAGASVSTAAAQNRSNDNDRRAQNSSNVSVTLRVSDNRNNYDRRGYRNSSNIVKKRIIKTRYRARILVEEKIVYGRRNDRLVCTVSVRGREAGYVTNRQLRRAANRTCSPRARIRYNA